MASIEVVPNVTNEDKITISKTNEPKTVYSTNDIAAFRFCSCEPHTTIRRYIGHRIISNTMKNKTKSRVQNEITSKISKINR